LRIIAGRLRGSNLFGPSNAKIRPTSDKARETLFNIIGPRVYDCRFLDLFAGTGAVGLEAISRGAKSATFIDSKNVEIIRKNADKLKLVEPADYTIIKSDAVQAMESLITVNKKFDIVFADPPWDAGLEKKIVEMAQTLLNKNGVLILEAFYKTILPKTAPQLALVKSRKSGEAVFYFYEQG